MRSYGGAGTVTGSCHLVELDGATVLVDCGAFQGSDELFDLNAQPFGFDPRALPAVLLTHAHLDHAGRLPLLVRRGYDGPIHALPATRALAEHLLLDAAKLQHEDSERNRRKGRPVREPLFDDDDVRRTLELFEEVAYGRPFELPGMRVTAQRAGHIPGSASFLLEGGGRSIVLSGDIGNIRKDVLPDPTPCPPADVVVMESTYGDRDHRPFEDTLAELASVLRAAAERGGKILIPSFALERTQDVLYHLARLEDEHGIPSLPVYVDSPLAARVEDVYATCRDELSDEVQLLYRNGRDPFAPKHLRYTRTVDESKEINASDAAAIVIAGSGMLSGGRILHHLRAHLDDPRTTVLIVGFQPRGGLGRLLVDRADHVRVLGTQVRVRADVVTVGGLSAHADRTELLDWSRGAGPDARLRLVHGEPEVSEALRATLVARGTHAVVQPSEVALPHDGPRHREEGGE